MNDVNQIQHSVATSSFPDEIQGEIKNWEKEFPWITAEALEMIYVDFRRQANLFIEEVVTPSSNDLIALKALLEKKFIYLIKDGFLNSLTEVKAMHALASQRFIIPEAALEEVIEKASLLNSSLKCTTSEEFNTLGA